MGAAGVCCCLLALTRWFKFLFVVWTLVVLYLMVKWFFLSSETSLSGAEMCGVADAGWSRRVPRRRLGFSAQKAARAGLVSVRF